MFSICGGNGVGGNGMLGTIGYPNGGIAPSLWVSREEAVEGSDEAERVALDCGRALLPGRASMIRRATLFSLHHQ